MRVSVSECVSESSMISSLGWEWSGVKVWWCDAA